MHLVTVFSLVVREKGHHELQMLISPEDAETRDHSISMRLCFSQCGVAAQYPDAECLLDRSLKILDTPNAQVWLKYS